MKIKLLLLLILPLVGFAQAREPLRGRVVNDGIPLKDILVVNLQLQKETRTDSLGNFTLPAKAGDEIAVADYRIREYKQKLTIEDIKTNPLLIPVIMNGYELSEVIIARQRISPSILNIPMGPKYTPAERRWRTAASMRPFLDQALTGAFIPLDPLFNAITGKTKELRKALEVEKKEQVITALNKIYDEKEIMAEFKIPAEYVKGFIYYIADNANVAAAIKDENFTKVRKLLGPLAFQYIQLINDK